MRTTPDLPEPSTDSLNLENMRFANVIERCFLTACDLLDRHGLNFLLKSHAELIYRLAVEAGDAELREVQRIIRDGPPPSKRQRHHGGRARKRR